MSAGPSVAQVLEAARRGRAELSDESVGDSADDVHIESHAFDPAEAAVSAQAIVAVCLCVIGLALLVIAVHTVWAAYRRSSVRPPPVPLTRSGQRAMVRLAQKANSESN